MPPPPLDPEDRRRLRGGDSSSDDEPVGNQPGDDEIPDPGLGVPGPGPGTQRMAEEDQFNIMPNEEEIVSTPDFSVTMKQVEFRRQRRFRYEDSHFRISFRRKKRKFKKTKKKNKDRIPLLDCIGLLKTVVRRIVFKLREKFNYMRCCFVFLTLVCPTIVGGLPAGGR